MQRMVNYRRASFTLTTIISVRQFILNTTSLSAITRNQASILTAGGIHISTTQVFTLQAIHPTQNQDFICAFCLKCFDEFTFFLFTGSQTHLCILDCHCLLYQLEVTSIQTSFWLPWWRFQHMESLHSSLTDLAGDFLYACHF